MSEDEASAQLAQAFIPVGCRAGRPGYNRYVLTSEWGVGLACNFVYAKLVSGCCGRGFEWDGRDFLLCEECLCETAVPKAYVGSTAHRWEDIEGVTEEIFEQNGLDVLEAALRASVVHELRSLVKP